MLSLFSTVNIYIMVRFTGIMNLEAAVFLTYISKILYNGRQSEILYQRQIRTRLKLDCK